MSGAPAFQFYPHDFLAGRVATYSLEAVGAYIMLLSFDWSLNGLPNSVEKLAKMVRVSSRRFENIWLEIADQFVAGEDGRLRNPRLQSVRIKQLAYSESMSKNGKRGGRPRKPGETHGFPAVKPEESTPSPSPTPKQKIVAIAPNWTAALGAVWIPRVGDVKFGFLGRVLKPSVDRYGAETVERAMGAYIAAKKSGGKTCKLQWFADEMAVWVERIGKMAVVDGEMTPELDLATRP